MWLITLAATSLNATFYQLMSQFYDSLLQVRPKTKPFHGIMPFLPHYFHRKETYEPAALLLELTFIFLVHVLSLPVHSKPYSFAST